MEIAVQKKTADKILFSSGIILKISIILLLIFTCHLLLAQQPNQDDSLKEQIDKDIKPTSNTVQSVDIERCLQKLERIANGLKDLSKRISELKIKTNENKSSVQLINLISDLQNEINDEESRTNSFQEEIRVQMEQIRHDNYLIQVIILGLGVLILASLFLLKNNKTPTFGCRSNSVDGLLNTDNDMLTFPVVSMIKENHLPAETFTSYATNYIITLFNNIKKIKIKNKIAYSSSKIAVATAKGNVRSENQDFCMAFETKCFQLMIMADGLGGVPHGREAAQIASVSAALSILKHLCPYKKIMIPDAQKSVRNAFESASQNLAYIANMLAMKKPVEGLRTTLIIVLVIRSHYIWGYIGDGGLCILRATGQEEKLLIPQKADLEVSNILAASLGPLIEGTPVFGISNRYTGDLILCGTDGIFDRVPLTFAHDVRKAIIGHNGDLAKVIDLLLAELSESKDECGYIFDDNMSIGIIKDESLVKPPSYLSETKPTTVALIKIKKGLSAIWKISLNPSQKRSIKPSVLSVQVDKVK